MERRGGGEKGNEERERRERGEGRVSGYVWWLNDISSIFQMHKNFTPHYTVGLEIFAVGNFRGCVIQCIT